MKKAESKCKLKKIIKWLKLLNTVNTFRYGLVKSVTQGMTFSRNVSKTWNQKYYTISYERGSELINGSDLN
jgi:hypothetical protein